jgi:hypothetical protein
MQNKMLGMQKKGLHAALAAALAEPTAAAILKKSAIHSLLQGAGVRRKRRSCGVYPFLDRTQRAENSKKTKTTLA